MNYNIKYNDMLELCQEILAERASDNGKQAQSSWLSEFNENAVEEAERLNIILPLIIWEVENDKLTPELSDELYLYYEDYVKGRLDDILAEYEKDDVIRDLTECFHKAFPEGLEE